MTSGRGSCVGNSYRWILEVAPFGMEPDVLHPKVPHKLNLELRGTEISRHPVNYVVSIQQRPLPEDQSKSLTEKLKLVIFHFDCSILATLLKNDFSSHYCYHSGEVAKY